MTFFDESDIDYPLTVTVTRPQGTYSANGDYSETFDTIIQNMTADIQLSLKVRKLIAENTTGTSDNTVWTMFCIPSQPIQTSDRVFDGTRTFVVDGVGDWGSHTECVMRLIEL